MALIAQVIWQSGCGSRISTKATLSAAACSVAWSKTLARYLVTGAAGFIGRSIAAALLARGETVRGIDGFITGKRET